MQAAIEPVKAVTKAMSETAEDSQRPKLALDPNVQWKTWHWEQVDLTEASHFQFSIKRKWQVLERAIDK